MLLAGLAGCGDLPRPFAGAPGGDSPRLLRPPPPRLAVDAPEPGVLGGRGDALYLTAMADALASQDVPAVAASARKGDWHLKLAIERSGGTLTPVFTVFDASGAQAGLAQGMAVPEQSWQRGDAETMRAVAVQAAPTIAGLLTRIEADRRAADPNSLVNREAKLMMGEVTGAPGDGNEQLARNMKIALANQGLRLVDKGADFTVSARITVVPQADRQDRIEIEWIVSDASSDRGHIVQLNNVPHGSLDHYWGDVAVVVTDEAAAGVKDVVAQQSGRTRK